MGLVLRWSQAQRVDADHFIVREVSYVYRWASRRPLMKTTVAVLLEMAGTDLTLVSQTKLNTPCCEMKIFLLRCSQ